jgi:hypothetical protein
VQEPLLHISVARQALPHTPQLLESVDRLVQLPLQLACPGMHPVTQDGAPPPPWPHTGVAPLQPIPHPPQLAVDPRLVVQPAPASAQSANPDAH